jgi:glutathionylspermidine synthase
MQPDTNIPGVGAYTAFAQELYDTNIISDPWIYGQERFRLEPIVIPDNVYARLCEAAEAMGRAYEELARIVWDRPSLLDDYFHMTPYQKLMWLASGGRWHGIARLDLFLLEDGSIQVCEMNSDTPSGEAEAVIPNRLRIPHHPGLHDPNEGFEERFVTMVMESYRAAGGAREGVPPSVGILYPTDLPEDLSMIALYRQWFEKRGCAVTLGSPFNLHHAPGGGITMFGNPIDIMLRHYKTDWWGERIPAWSDEPDYNDPDPLDEQLRLALDADAAGTLTVINPFGAVVTQNKLTMAFLWNNIELFSEETRHAIRAYIPETHRLLDVDRATTTREEWVLKSDYGCEGDEVVVGRDVDDAIWSASLELATPERWIVQRYFHAAHIEGDLVPNYGVYLIAGRAAGIFTRLSSRATDYSAVVAPTFTGGNAKL